MDGESSYESDISESWSLIDINLNEELPETDTSSKLQKSPLSKFKNVKLRKIDEIELEDFVRKCKEINKADFNQLSDSDSDSSNKDQELGSCSRTDLDQIDSPCKRASDNDGKNDSGDTESIEILDMDGNCQDLDLDRLVLSNEPIDFVTYQSDDEESLEGGVKFENRSYSSTAIKRKRRRISRNSENAVHSVNSENNFDVRNNLKICSNDAEEKNYQYNETDNKARGNPVYKHYRNNVANTVLSLSVGVIFAGVACMAIGHFLGVQDAAENAMELTAALKKLQVENVALQSRLFHLNKALHTREMNHKLELSPNQPHIEVSDEETPKFDPSKIENSDLNSAALSEIRSSLTSIEWLSKLQNFVRRNKKETETENGIDFCNFRKYIHDQLHFLNNKEEKSLEDIGKISKITNDITKKLQMIFNSLSSSQENIENLFNRGIIKFKDINNKLNKIVLDSPRKSKSENKMPVTELDLQKIQWVSKNEVHENSEEENSESVGLYKFPQPQKYYEIENNSKSVKQAQLEVTKPNGTLLNSDSFQKAQKEKKYRKKYKQKNEREKKKEKKHVKNAKKNEKLNEKVVKKKNEEKRKKRGANIGKKVMKKTEKISEKGSATFGLNQVNYIVTRGPLNETNSRSKKYLKPREKNLNAKRRSKKSKNSKFKKSSLSKPSRRSHVKENEFSRLCSGFQCFNLTGDWVFKWAGGREEIRRHHSLGEWQFERAKGRKEVRDIIFNDNWQFERAKARKKLRVDDHNENWQFKRASARESNRRDDHWHREKDGVKYNGKEFFHESFSWI